MSREQDRKNVKDLLDSLEIIKKVQERSDDFDRGRKQYESYNQAKRPEPALKLRGGPYYKRDNHPEQKKEVLFQIRDRQQQHNKELNTIIKNEAVACGMNKESLKNIDLLKVLDERIEERHTQSNERTYTNREVNKYLFERGINPEETREKNKPLDKKDVAKIPAVDKELFILKEPQIEKLKTMEKNKKDMDIER